MQIVKIVALLFLEMQLISANKVLWNKCSIYAVYSSNEYTSRNAFLILYKGNHYNIGICKLFLIYCSSKFEVFANKIIP